jgi:DNA polymerase III gamma/tau subunit
MQEISWYMKYAPKEVDDYVFYENYHKDIVSKWLDNGFIDGNILLYGPPGVGKTALSELLIKKLITHQYDIKVIKSRSVNQIDELFGWCQTVPTKSKKKIVYIEEFDKLSSTAHTAMKDSLLEKFQDNVSFICNTNFINKIDSAVISRFNYKLRLVGDKNNTYDRLTHILINENITYNEDILKSFVEKNYTKGLRNLITSIQIGSMSGLLNLEDINDTYENLIIEHTINIYNTIMKESKAGNKQKQILLDPLNSVISEEYSKIINIIYYNYDINWDVVFMELERQIAFVPVKIIISDFIDSIENKKLPYVHYISFLYKSMKVFMEFL